MQRPFKNKKLIFIILIKIFNAKSSEEKKLFPFESIKFIFLVKNKIGKRIICIPKLKIPFQNNK